MARKFFALENADNSAYGNEALTAEDMAEAGEGVEEVAVDSAEVDELATAIEDAEVAADNLEETAEVLEAGVESGEGVSEETAQAAEIAVEAALNMLGTSHRGSSLMPSLESWGSGQSRLQATKIALEGVTDKIKEIWKRIVEYVKMIAQKVLDFFVKFFDNTDRLKKNVAKARAKVNENSGTKKKENTLKNSSVANYFNDGNGKASFDSALTILSHHNAATAATAEFVRVASEFVNSLKGAQDDSESIMTSKVEKAFGNLKGFSKYKEGDEAGVATDPLIGGRRMFVSFGTAKEPSLGFKVIEPKKKAEKEIAALDKAQCLELLSAVDSLAKSTEEYKKVKGNLEGLTKATAKLADEALRMVDKEGSMAGWRKAITAMSSTSGRMTTMMPAWNVKIGNVAINYVLASVSNLEGGGKK